MKIDIKGKSAEPIESKTPPREAGPDVAQARAELKKLGVTAEDFENYARKTGHGGFKAKDKFNLDKVPDGYIMSVYEYLSNGGDSSNSEPKPLVFEMSPLPNGNSPLSDINGKYFDDVKPSVSSPSETEDTKERKKDKSRFKRAITAVALAATIAVASVGVATKGFGLFKKTKPDVESDTSISSHQDAGKVSAYDTPETTAADTTTANTQTPSYIHGHGNHNHDDHSGDEDDSSETGGEGLDDLSDTEFNEKIEKAIESLPVDENADAKFTAESNSPFGLSYTLNDGDRYYASSDHSEFNASGGKTGFGTVGGEYGLFNKAGQYSIESVVVKDATGKMIKNQGAWSKGQLLDLQLDADFYGNNTFSVHLSRYDENGRSIAGWVDLSEEDAKKFITGLQTNQMLPVKTEIIGEEANVNGPSIEDEISATAEFVEGAYTRAEMLKDIEDIATKDPEAFAKLGLRVTRSTKNDRIYVQNIIDNGEHGIGYSFASNNELAWAIAKYSIPAGS